MESKILVDFVSKISFKNYMILANAKTNIFLAITGQRVDGYHELISLNIPNDISDQITITESNSWAFTCNDQTLIKSNIVQKAIEQLRPFLSKKYHINLEKKIPKLSGFGGGSSDAVAVLKFLNMHENLGLSCEKLAKIAKNIGADCTFFIQNTSSIVSGIGDIVSPLNEQVLQNLKKYHMLILKPPFDVETKLAYQKLRTTYRHLYLPHSQATTQLNNLIDEISNFCPKLSLFNTFSGIVFSEHDELRALQGQLAQIDVNFMLSGSGSGCFCLFQDYTKTPLVIDLIKRSLGQNIFIQQTKIL